jgi:PAS domain S-box-containing protein
MSGEKILIVEDEKIVAKDIRSRLELLGYNVVATASTGPEAVTEAERTVPDIVLMDIVLKGKMDGIDAAGKIIEKLGVPVIYLTAYTDEDTLRRAKVTDPYGYLVKPFVDKEVLITIEMAIHKHRAERALKESESRFRSFVELSCDAVVMMDSESRIILWNKGAEDIFGYAEKEVLGKSVSMLSPKRFLEGNARGLFPGSGMQVMKNAEEKVGLRKDGTEFIAEISHVAWSSGSKKFYGSIIRDITDRKRTADKLRESEERLRLIVENTMDIIYTASPDGVINYISPQVARWGFIPEEVIGREFLDLLYPDDVARVLAEFQETKGEAIELPVSFRLKTKSGQIRHLEANAKAIWKDGDLAELIGVIRDVTEKVRIEQALKAREEKYRLLAQNVTDIIWTMDLDMKYTFVSPSVAKLRGYTDEEVMKQTVKDVMTEESAKTVMKTLKESLELEAAGKAERGQSVQMEVELYRKDGTTVWAEIVVGFIRDDKGTPVGLLGVTRDLTQRRKSEAELREKSALLEEVINTVSDGIFVLDDHGNYVLINPASGLTVGQDPMEWLGKRADSSLHPDDVSECIQNFLTALGGEGCTFNARVKAASGYRNLQVKLTPMSISGKPHVLGIVIDMTDRKRPS